MTEDMKVTLVETGVHTMTAGRLKRVQSYIADETFMLTYGDGLSDVNLKDLLTFHKSHGKIATVTAIQPAGKFPFSLRGHWLFRFLEALAYHTLCLAT